MDQDALAEIKALEAAGDIENPRYMELLMRAHYVHHVLRMPAADWPDPVQRGFAHINPKIYVSMQGPSELGISADAKLAALGPDRGPGRDRGADAGHRCRARHDGPGPHGDDGRRACPPASYLYCPDGSHLAMYDDQRTYFAGLIDFLLGRAG